MDIREEFHTNVLLGNPQIGVPDDRHMSNPFSPPLSLQRRFRRLPEDLSSLIPVKQWAEQHSYAANSVVQMIQRGKLVGYKTGGRWYVDANYPKLDMGKYP